MESKTVKLTVFRPKGRRRYEIRCTAEEAAEKEAAYRAGGWCVTRDAIAAKPAPAAKKKRKLGPEAARAKRLRELARRREKIEALRQKLARAGSMNERAAAEAARELCPKSWTTQAELGLPRNPKRAERALCRINAGRMDRTIPDFPMFFIKATAEAGSFEIALVILKGAVQRELERERVARADLAKRRAARMEAAAAKLAAELEEMGGAS